MTTTTKQPKEKPVTTHAAKTDLDISKLSVEEMLALAEKLKATAQEQSQKLFDNSMTFLNEKLKAMGRSKFEAMEALYVLMDAAEKQRVIDQFRAKFGYTSAPAPARQRAPRASKPGAAAARPYVKGVTYKYQNEVWVGGTKGRRPPWLRDLIPETMSFEEQVAKYKELAVETGVKN